MKNRGLILICILLLSVFCYAQKETNYWYFGANAGVTFNSGAPVAVTNGALSTLEGCSAISDPDGNLLFYTDGIRVWNRNHVVMTNGNGLQGDPSSSQSGIIVPKPGSLTRFYVFTVDAEVGVGGFRYSEVDMSASGGLGAVVAGQKNILLRSLSTEGLTAVKHANGTDVWVIIKGWNNNSYYAYLVTSAGVNASPVVSSLGPVVSGVNGAAAIGYMKAAPDGSKIATCHSYVLNRVIVSDFNTATGQLSNAINILVSPTPSSTGPYGVEFSNCNEYLYVGESDDFVSRIFRYDLNAANIPASVTTFATINGPYLGALQLALDGKIYVAYSGATHLQAINNPKLPSATFQIDAVHLGGRVSRYGLPPFITSFFNEFNISAISSVTADTIICLGDTTLFSAQISSYDSIRWYFGDPTTGPNNTSTLLNPSHYYANAGAYTATLYKYQCNTIDSIKKTIDVRPYPFFNILDTTGCAGTPIVLDPGISGVTYNWSTGQTSQTATFNTSGNFSLTVTQNQCSYADNFNVTFNPLPLATITPGGPTTFCSPGSVLLSAPAGMTSYQWFLNGNPIGGQTGQTFTASASGNYTVRVENNNCFNTSPAQVVTVNSSPTVTVTPAGPIDICSGNTTTLTITTGGLSGIAWYRNGVVIGGQTASTLSVNTSGSYYATGQSSGCTGTSNTVVVNVSPASPAGVSISASSNPICAGTSVTFTATPTNGGATPVYQWLLNGNPVGSNSPTYTNAALANGNQVQVRMTSSSTCATGNPATSTAITMTVNPAAPVAVSISPSSNNICSGTAVTFTATPTNGSAAPVYQWLLNGNPVGSNSATYSNSSLSNGDQVRVQLTSNANCATGNPALSNTVTMTVSAVAPVSVSISPSSNNICSGTAVTFTATPTNGGAAPVYQWLLNGNPVGSNSTTYSNSSLSNGDQVRVQLTSNANCATGSPALSNTVTMTVNPVSLVSVTISANENPVCIGTNVTFTAVPVNGGAAPVYQWLLNGNPVGSNNSSYSNASLSNGDQVRVQLTSNATCATGSPALSNILNMSVNANLPVSVSVSPSANPVCSGSTVNFTATPTNGGASPAYQWLLNGNPAGSNSATYSNNSLSNGDQVRVVLTSSSGCATGSPATSNTVTITVNPTQAASVSISPSANNICAGTAVTFTATPVNGGSSPSYQWLLNGNPVGSNSTSYSNNSLVISDQVSVVMTSNATCATGSPATSNTVNMTVNATQAVSVSIVADQNPICAGTGVTFTATPTNGGASPAYQWLVNGSPVGSNSPTFSSTSLADGDQVRVQLSSNASCATGSPALSNIVNMQVNGVLPVSVNITASENPICTGTAVTFTATPVNGGASPAYQWLLNNNPVGNNSPTYSNNSLSDGDQLIVVLSSSENCPTGSPAASNVVDMVVNPFPVVDLGPDQSHCEGIQITLDAGTGADSYTWNTGETTNSINVAVSGNYSVVVVQNGCSASDTVSVTFDKQLPPTFSLGQDTEICEGDVLTLTPPTGTGYTYLWQDGSTSTTYAVTDSGFYYVMVENECGSSSDSILITTDPCIVCEIFVPTGFSPNGDGVNDTFFPLSNCDIIGYRFVVYNRWNELLFESNQVGEGWNGTYKGVSQPIDVYIYHISYTFPEILQPLQQNGIISLLR